MGALEIVLLIIGGVVFVLSFLLPTNKAADEETKKQVQDEARKAVADEIDGAKGRIEDIVEETIHYSMEKTERALERVSNEKIMAVNEYSDTVLEEINKNHKEVMFLYDMLNEKHDNVKATVSRMESAVKEAKQAADVTAAENAAGEDSGKDAAATTEKKPRKRSTRSKTVVAAEAAPEGEFTALAPEKVTKKTSSKRTAKNTTTKIAETDVSMIKEDPKNGNSNERILQLHKEGVSDVAIAQELGLGVGEVKLVIELFKGM